MSGFAKAVVKVTKDFDGKGIAALRERIKAAGGVSVRVGLPDGKTEKDGTPLTTLGFVHEFGAPQKGIPERSFMRSTMHEQGKKYAETMGKGLRDIANGKTTANEVLGKVGVVATGDVQAKIASGDFVALDPKTIKRKGSSKPLIDTGQLRQSVAWEISND